ncbi:MAG: HAD family phosphatase [Pirellulales bacterium]
MPPKILYFDLGKVLVEFSHERMFQQMAEVAGISPDAVRDALFGNQDCRAAQIQYETGHLTTDEFFDHFCQATGTSPDRKRLADAVCDIFSPIEPMWELVRSLAAVGNRLAILSNTNQMQWDFVTDGRFPIVAVGQSVSAFDWAILSYEVGSMKPDRAIYDTAIQRAGVAADEVFFTDDRLENVEGARAVGIDAVQFVDCEGLVSQLRERGVAGA